MRDLYLERTELQHDDDYGITNLERHNGFHMLMRNYELAPQPTRHESILFAQIPCKWNGFSLQIWSLMLLMTFYSETFLLRLNNHTGSKSCPSSCSSWHLKKPTTHSVADCSGGLRSLHRPAFHSPLLCITSALYMYFLHWLCLFWKAAMLSYEQSDICECRDAHTRTHTQHPRTHTHRGCDQTGTPCLHFYGDFIILRWF